MAVALQSPPRTEPRLLPKLEPLENGDCLTAREFLRRYEAMPHVKKAELIEGVVYMGSPVRLVHAEPDALVQTWLGCYAAHTPGVMLANNATVRFDADNVLQPDALLRILPESGGSARSGADGYLHGPPEIVAEIAASSAAIDLRDKLQVYRRTGVREYLVWRTSENLLDWFVLEDDEYSPQQPDAQGILESRAFPGLRLNVQALLAQDAASVLQALHAGLASEAHAAFVARLKAASQR